MKHKFLLAVSALVSVALFTSACKTPDDTKWSPAVPAGCLTPGSETYYFGPTLGTRRPTIDLTAVLDGAASPSLYCADRAPETYRLIYTKWSLAYVVTIARAGRSWQSTAVALAPVPRTVTEYIRQSHVQREVAERDVSSLKSGLDRADFWSTDAEESRTSDDGDAMAIEAATSTGYRVVMRASPGDGAFVRTAFMFFELAGLPYPEGATLPWDRHP